MKKSFKLILIFLIAFQIVGYGQKRNTERKEKADTLKVDSLQYELVILDPGFDSWLATQPPRDFYSNDYYASKNRLYVSEWNQRYMTSRRKDLYESYIDYNPNVNYDIDLNYRLYYYFRYFEEMNHVKLINSAR
jgi:hypothetical protein